MFQRAMASWGRLFGWEQNDKPPEEERRASLRLTCDVPTLLHPAVEASEPTLPARVRNISASGVSLVVDRAFALGQMLSMVLPHPDREPPTTVLVCVVRVDHLKDGRCQLGCNFSAPITDADLQLFAPPTDSAQVPEERAWERYPSHAHATYHRVNAAEPEGHAARVLNLSINGIALQAKVPMEVGELLNIDLRDDHGRLIVSILACVVRVRGEQNGGEWLFGCNFMNELSEEQLRMLV
jgi:hypothetical protein